jgi:hypothetical protein
MPLQELEKNKKPEIIEELPVTAEEPKKGKSGEIENSSLWQRIKNKVLRPIKNVVFAIYNRIVLGKNYSDTVAKDYDRARDEGLIDGMFDDGEYVPEDLTPEELAQEKKVLEDFEREDLGDMFDAPLVEQKVAQKDMTTILKEKINELSEKDNVDKIKLVSRSNVLNNEIFLEKDDSNNILISFKGKNLHKDFILYPPYEEQDIDKLTQEYQNFFSEVKKQREIELEVMKMFEDPKQTKEDAQTKEDKETEEEKTETQEISEEKEDVAEIPDFSDEKPQQENELESDVSEIPDFNEDEKSSITYIALSKDAFNKCVEKAENGDKVLAQTKTKDKSLADVLFERDNEEDRITIDEVVQSPKNTKNALNNIVDKNKQKEFKTAVITTVETMKTYNEKGDYVVASDTLTAKLSVKEEELTISVETLSGEVKEATIAYPPEKSEVTQTIADLLSQPEQNRTADQPLVVSVAEDIIEGEPPITQVEIGNTKTAQEAYEASFAEMLERDIDGFEPDENGEMTEIDRGDDYSK